MKNNQDQKKRGQASLKRRAKHLEMVRWDVAGIDVGANEIFVCAPGLEPGTVETRVFGATTPELIKIGDWLKERKVKSAAMESTGVYWIPLFEILENRGLEVLLTDTRHLSRVPGRKTDMIDAEWLQTLHAHGLLNGCFRPEERIVQLRTIVRLKAVLVSERADWIRRMQKELDQMNVRVHRAVSDLEGVTGMRITRAIVAGERDPGKLAQLRDRGCRKSESEIAEELTGHWREDHVFALTVALKMYDTLGERIAELEAEILRRMEELRCERARDLEAPKVEKRSKAKSIQRRKQEPARQALFGMTAVDVTAIDGVGVETVETVISEYGPTLERFPSEKQFIRHVRLSPRQNITGGKPVRRRRGDKGMTRAGAALRTAATSVEKTATALGAYFRRIARTKDRGTAVFATARKIGTLIYRALRWGQPYLDEGAALYEQRQLEARLHVLRKNAAQLGYQLAPLADVSVCP